MELTASGMDVAAARKVTLETMVGISDSCGVVRGSITLCWAPECSRSPTSKWQLRARPLPLSLPELSLCNSHLRKFDRLDDADSNTRPVAISVHQTSRNANPPIHSNDIPKMSMNLLEPLEGQGLSSLSSCHELTKSV